MDAQSLTQLDLAVARMRARVERLEQMVRSPVLEASARELLTPLVTTMSGDLEVLEQESAILGFPDEAEDMAATRAPDLSGAFDHLKDQVDLLEDTVGGPQIEPTQRGVLAMHLDAIREAFAVVERESARVSQESADAVVEANLLTAQLEEAQERTAREYQKSRASQGILEEFLTSVSHELRTPLHGILSFARLGQRKLSKGQLTTEKQLEYFNRVEECGDVLLRLVDELLDLSRLERHRVSLEVGRTRLEPVIDAVLRETEALAEERGIQLIRRIEEDGWACVDETRIMQVIRNLISNALRWAPEGSPVTLRLRRDGKFLEFACRDRGPGIPEDNLERVFERYVSTAAERDQSGFGIGLAIARHLVELHGGSIWARNHPKGGSIFSFSIPLDESMSVGR